MLTLSIGGTTAKITKFTDDGYERIFATTGNTEYSIAGTPIDTGTTHQPKMIWTISAFLNINNWQKIQEIYHAQDILRRQMSVNYRITLLDAIQEVVEPAPRTRALIPGTFEATSGNSVIYYSQFNVRMLEPKSKKTQSQSYPYIFTCTLKELDTRNP